MTLYLQMPSSAKLTTPSFSFTDMKLDMKIDVGNTGTGITALYTNFNNQLAFGTNLRPASGAIATINGTSIAYNTNISSYFGQRILMDISTTNTINASGGYIGGFTGRLYDVKFYNGSTLIAHYDMTTGTVNDQSGNGYNATLTGGTWLDDGGGSTTTYVGSGASNGLASLSSPEKSILKDGSLIQVNPSLTVNEDMIMAMSGSVQALSSLSSGESLITHSGSLYSGSGITLAYSILSSNELKNFAASGSLIGTSSMIDDHSMMLFEAKGDIISQAILSSKDLYNGKPNPQTFITNGSIQGHTLIFTKEVLNHFTIPFYQVAKIYLKGEQQLNVYLVGEMMNTITLKGSE
jgi:hypothetical protein